jgi:nucleoside-diphosphate kinase
MNTPHPSLEQTLLIVKPDGVQRTLVGEVVKRIERVGLKLVAAKIVVADEAKARAHYTSDPTWLAKVGAKSIAAAQARGAAHPATPELAGEAILAKLLKYLASGPVFATVWQGAHACAVVRKLVGGTEPLTSDVGTIRGDLMLDSYEMSELDGRAVRNIVHASGSPEEAALEIPVWFAADEIVRYNLAHDRILYDVNLDGILE